MNHDSEIRLRALERQVARARDDGQREPLERSGRGTSGWHKARAAAIGWTLGKIGLGVLAAAALLLAIDRKVAVLEAKLEWIVKSVDSIESRMDRNNGGTKP